MRPLRVATYNVHACVGTDGKHDPDRVAAVIDAVDPDIIALQEFTYPAEVALESRRPGVLTALDQYECALGPTRASMQLCFGNAIFTRHRIVEVHRMDLSVERREPRGALAATIDVAGTEVHVLAAHLGLKLAERRFQVSQIVDYLDSMDGALVIVLGDFNDWLPGRSVVHALDHRLGRASRIPSFPSSWPLLRLDRVWVQPASALKRVKTFRKRGARKASDHLPVVADLDLPA